MKWKVIKTEADYKNTLHRTMQIFHAEEGTPDEDELALLLVKDYEGKNIRLPKLDPIEAVKLKMEERGIKAEYLEPLPGSKGHISFVLWGRRELTLNTAKRLREYF